MGNNHGIGRACLASVLIPFVMYEFGFGNIDPTVGFGREAVWMRNHEAKAPDLENKDTEQGGAGYPPQGVGSPDP